MAFTMNIGGNKQEKKKEYAKIDSFGVSRVKIWDNGITFDLEVNQVKIYGCTVRQSKDGGYFISFPSRKGSNGTYYSQAYVALSPECTEQILEEVQRIAESASK